MVFFKKQNEGSLLHELGHVIGFWHEQSRPDRDSHVNVDKNAIEEGRLYNFYKSSWQYVDTKNVSYDVSSIMHYSATVSYSLPTFNIENNIIMHALMAFWPLIKITVSNFWHTIEMFINILCYILLIRHVISP